MDAGAWFERVTQQVTESGVHVERIQLTQASASWHVWEMPKAGWPDAEDWHGEFQRIMTELTEQWPARKIPCILIAETRSGTVLSQCPFQVTGKDRTATSTSSDGGQMKMIAETTEMLQRSWEKTLNVTNAQLEIQAKQVQKFGEQIIELLTYVRQSEEYRATEAQRKLELEQATREDPLLEEVKKALPGILELAQMYATQKLKEGAQKVTGSSPAGRAVGAAVNAVVDSVTDNN